MSARANSPIYDDLMRFKPEGLTPNGWAVLAGVSRTVWADMRRHGNPSRRTLEKLLKAAGSSLAEFEALRITGAVASQSATEGVADPSPLGWGAAQLPPLPQVKAVAAGFWHGSENTIPLLEIRPGELCGNVPRPVSLARDAKAYALALADESMWPRFRYGRIIAVSPAAPVALGDDVLVKLKTAAAGAHAPVLVRELVQRTAHGVELRQFNPDVTFCVPAIDIVSIEKVLGELV